VLITPCVGRPRESRVGCYRYQRSSPLITNCRWSWTCRMGLADNISVVSLSLSLSLSLSVCLSRLLCRAWRVLVRGRVAVSACVRCSLCRVCAVTIVTGWPATMRGTNYSNGPCCPSVCRTRIPPQLREIMLRLLCNANRKSEFVIKIRVRMYRFAPV